MNRLIYTAGLLIASLGTICAQDKIEGIGIFKVGKMTVTEFEQYANANSLTITKTSTSEESYRNRNAALQEFVVSSPTAFENPPYASYCPQTRVFSLNSYTVAGIEVRGLRLNFYENQLIRVTCSNPSDALINAVKIKYGQPIETTEKRKGSCPTGREDSDYRSTWVNGPIKAVSALISYLTPDCATKITTYFVVQNEVLADAESRCGESGKNQFLQGERAKKKESLKDF